MKLKLDDGTIREASVTQNIAGWRITAVELDRKDLETLLNAPDLHHTVAMLYTRMKVGE